MKIKHFNLPDPLAHMYSDEKWSRGWHGLEEMPECVSSQLKKSWQKRDEESHLNGRISEVEFERDIILSLLQTINKKSITFCELGAGWGRMSLAVTGAIRNKIVSDLPESVDCIAVEADKEHCYWLREHFYYNAISGGYYHAAITSFSGNCDFYIYDNARDCYGQAIVPLVSMGWLGLKLKDKLRRVSAMTIDEIVGNKHVDLIHMDIQGAEVEAIKGAKKSLNNIDYFYIGVHSDRLGDRLKDLLLKSHELIIDYPRNTTVYAADMPPCWIEEGIQLWRRKGL